MRQNPQLRWIEEKDARGFREIARLEGAASEPKVTIADAEPGPVWLLRARALIPKIISTFAVRPSADRYGNGV